MRRPRHRRSRSEIRKGPVATLKVEVAADHFLNVRGLTKGLIARIKDNAKAEASQKSFRDIKGQCNFEQRQRERDD